MPILNVSGYGNNCGLYALGLAISLHLKKINQSPPAVPQFLYELQCEDVQTGSQALKQIGCMMRKKLAEAIKQDLRHKERRLQSVLQICLTNSAPPVDMESFFKSSGEIFAAIKLQGNNFFTEIENYNIFHFFSGTFDEIKTELCKHFKVAQLPQNVGETNEDWFFKQSELILSTQNIPSDDANKTLFILGEAAIALAIGIEDAYTNAHRIYMTFLLKNKWDEIYENYAHYINNNEVMLSADELGCLAQSFGFNLNILFTENILLYSTDSKGNMNSVTLCNPSQNHWQVEYEGTALPNTVSITPVNMGNALLSSSTISQSPIQVQNIITSLAHNEKPLLYSRYHLLAAGFAGTVYQLLVLLTQITKLLANGISFEVVMEKNKVGNLDDIVFILKKDSSVIALQAYQVKHYNHPIKVYDFFNEPTDTVVSEKKEDKKKAKTEKMHIGKFFAGWLAWLDNYPALSQNKNCLTSIVYSNAETDSILSSCIDDKGKFKSDFVQNKKNVIFPEKSSIKNKIKKNFMIHANPKWTVTKSTKMWDHLVEIGFLDVNGCFTHLFNPQDPKLPPAVQAQLNALHSQYSNNQSNLYNLLYEQAWDYLKTHFLHLHRQNSNEEEKTKLFQEFLQSFHFQLKQGDFDQQESDIQHNLALILVTKGPMDQIFVCLYYAVSEWFRKEYEKQKTPTLTNVLMQELINQAFTRAQSFIELQGYTKATLAQIDYKCNGLSILRTELSDLKNKLEAKKIQMVAVVGEKGLGKSGLMKQALEAFPYEYLFLSALDLLNEKLQADLVSVIQNVQMIRIVAIDNAESLLTLPEEKLKSFLGNLSRVTVVLTLTSEASQQFLRLSPFYAIKLTPLPVTEIKKTFPELAPLQSLLKLAERPFYLSLMIRLILKRGPDAPLLLDSSYEFRRKSRNIVEADLLKLTVDGTDIATRILRQGAWQQLSFKIAQSINYSSQGIQLSATSPGLDLLIQDHIVIKNNNYYRFEHDLFFEQGLVELVLKKWELAIIEESSEPFWGTFPELIQTIKNREIFKKWIVQYGEELTLNLIRYPAIIAAMPDFINAILQFAVETKKDELLECYLVHKGTLSLDQILTENPVLTYILLAIQADYPVGLQKLINHGASLSYPSLSNYGHNFLNSDESETESSNDSSDIESEEGYDLESFDSDEERNDEDSTHFESSPLEDLIKKFADDPSKYWSAGFDEERGEFNEEGEWISNPVYDPPRNNAPSYVYQAVLLNRPNCLSVLLSQHEQSNNEEAILRLRNNCGETALHIGVLKNYYDLVKLLLESDFNNNIIALTDRWGETALHNAVYQGYVNIAKLLLDNNAQINVENEWGLTPFDIAMARIDLNMVVLLLQYDADFLHHPFKDEDMTGADLLELVESTTNSNQIEQFVIDLIEALNYGWDNDNISVIDEKMEFVEDLMTWIEHRAQLSEHFPGFDYYDEESMLTYAMENGDSEKIEELKDYILADAERIEDVFESEIMSNLKDEIFIPWFDEANSDQRTECNAYILNNVNVIDWILSLPENENIREDLIIEWQNVATEAQKKNLQNVLDSLPKQNFKLTL